MTSLLDLALGSEKLIVSTAGRHATEEWNEIVRRKSADVSKVGHTFWLVNANNARPNMVQDYCRDSGAEYVVFVTREANVLPGATAVVADVGTTSAHVAREYSVDAHRWQALAAGLSPVTGRINRATTGFYLEALEEVQPKISIDLSAFVIEPGGSILTGFKQSDPAYLVRRVGNIAPGRYRVLAVGKLASPYAVWLKAAPYLQ